MSAPTCSKPGCAAVPVFREDVRPNGFCPPSAPPRTYLLCARHDADYFAGNVFLHVDRSRRIKAELIPKEAA